MPLVKIETRRSWSASQKQEIMEAVHSAMREALKIPENDRDIRFHEYPSEDFQVSPDKTQNYALIEISMFAGRSLQAKKELYQGIVTNLGKLGILAGDVFIVLHEVPLDNWGIRGGLASLSKQSCRTFIDLYQQPCSNFHDFVALSEKSGSNC